MSDPLRPIYVRLRTSTVEALRDAQARSHHRTIAAYVDEVLRRHLAQLSPTHDNVDRLAASAKSLRDGA